MKTFTQPLQLIIRAAFIVLLLFAGSNIQSASAITTIYFVKPAVSGTGTCSSWANACTLQTALGSVSANSEIWVMEGTYTPGTLRSDTFQLITDVGIYGGFDGTETQRIQRDPATNITILSGDIGGDDSQSPITDMDTVTGNTNNAYHVVTGSSVTSTAVLDGFTITAGYADGSNPDWKGGGIYNEIGSPTLANLTITGNYSEFGGGIYNNQSNSSISNTIISNNLSISSGGGITNEQSSLTITNVVFRDNEATTFGGGMYSITSSNFSMEKVTFSGNTAGSSAGGLFSGTSNPTLTNVTFSSNTAGSGGGMVSSGGSPTLNNVTISGNTATSSGGGFTSTSSSVPILYNVIIWGNTAPGSNNFLLISGTPTIVDSVIEGGCPSGATCTDYITTDPLLGALADNGGFTETMALGEGSSAIDSGGSNVACAADDQVGTSRPQDGNGDNTAYCDIGAYEVPDVGSRFYTKPAATGTEDCFSWDNACTLATALGSASDGDEIWVMQGTHIPGLDRISTFQLVSGVGVYGGFAGNETARSQRDPLVNTTILSGDVDSNDSQNPITNLGTVGNNTLNAYHVVTGSGADSTAILDGFTITAGYTNGSFPDNSGSGMYIQAGTPTLSNLTFTGNYAENGAGIMNYSNSGLEMSNITFSNNQATTSGGGIYNYNAGTPTMTNLTFYNNTAYTGGGISNANSDPTINNVTINSNSATYGGGIYNSNGSSPTVNNVILWGDSASNSPEMYNDGTSVPTINDSVIEGGCPSGANCTNVISTDPVLDPLAHNGGVTQTILLGGSSSALDAGGVNSTCAAEDQRGVSRPQNSGCDIGATETYHGVFYAKTSASGNEDCTSWADACTLQTALSFAHAGDEIWVMEGTYVPTTNSAERDATFQLITGVAIYGGFDGTETLRNQRDVDTNVTILSGDIDGDDSQSPITDITTVTGNTLNAYHVVTSSGVDSTAILDGFTITGGYADGASAQSYGGGILNAAGSPTLNNLVITGNFSDIGGGGMANNSSSSPSLNTVTFSGNDSSNGGGMFNNNSSPSLVFVIFVGNTANNGGGIFSQSTSHPTLTDVTFDSNEAYYGAGFLNSGGSDPVLNKVTFDSNTAGYDGGGFYNNAGSDPSLTNVTFYNNEATAAAGGGFYNNDTSNPTLNNVTLVNNTAGTGGGIFNGTTSVPYFNNIILWGNIATTAAGGPQLRNSGGTPTINDGVVEGGCPADTTCNNVISDNPFLGLLADNGGFTETIALGNGSSAQNIGGVNAACEATDQRDFTRPQGSGCDVGAYEKYEGVFYTKPSATGEGNCTSWTDACTLATALDIIFINGEIWVMEGTHVPGSSRTDTFALVNGVDMYGGFDGTETLRSERDPETNVTILSGDIDGNDTQNPITDLSTVSNNTDNAYNVITADGVFDTTIVDGFTITAGYADGSTPYFDGAAIYNFSSDVTLSNLIITGNWSMNTGGAMINIISDSSLTNVTFSNNESDTGGALYNTGGSLTFTDVTFANNKANYGAAVANNGSSQTYNNVTFSGNIATYYGGALYNINTSNSTLTNVTISGNEAGTGGVIYNLNSNPVFNNATIQGNTASSSGVLYNYSGSPTFNNTIVWGNISTSGDNFYFNSGDSVMNDSVVDGGCPAGASCTNIFTGNPLLQALADNGGYTETMEIASGSSAIDNGGTNVACAATDQRGVSRPQGSTCDIGAFEVEALDSTGPTVSFTTPTVNGDSLMLPRALLIVDASDADSGMKEVEFHVYYDSTWHLVGTDTDGSDGWSFQWSSFEATETTVNVKAVAIDNLDNQAEAQLDNISLTDTITFGSGYETRGGEEAGICTVEIIVQPAPNIDANFNDLLTPLEVIRTKMQ